MLDKGLVFVDGITMKGDGSPVHPLASPGAMLSKSISLSSAQLKSLGSSPILLVPAPGPNKIILPLNGIYRYSPKTTAYSFVPATNPGLALTTNTNGGLLNIIADITNGGTFGLDTLIPSAAEFFPVGNALDSDPANENKPLFIQTIDQSNGNLGFDLILGDGTLTLIAFYTIG